MNFVNKCTHRSAYLVLAIDADACAFQHCHCRIVGSFVVPANDWLMVVLAAKLMAGHEATDLIEDFDLVAVNGPFALTVVALTLVEVSVGPSYLVAIIKRSTKNGKKTED